MTAPASLLDRSPLDAPGVGLPLVALRRRARERWIPSRYNARTVHDDGRLVLWNTWTGAVSVFPAAQREAVERLLARAGVDDAATGLPHYLAERGFLVRAEVDELRRLRTAFGQEQYRTDILELILLASEDCNFRCTYCYEDFLRGTMRPEVREGIRRLVALRAPTLRTLGVAWFGGEPLYGWEAVEELSPYFMAMAEEYDLAYSAAMTTNGYLLTPERQERLLAWGVRNYQITVDGTAETHDRMRVARDGSPTWHRIMDNLEALHARPEDYGVRLRVNYDQSNVHAIDALLDIVRARFEADPRFRVSLHAVGRWGGANDANLPVCGTEQRREVRARLRTRARELGLAMGGGVVEHHGAIHGTGVCYAARPFNFIVGATGTLMKCTVALDKHDYNIVGRLTPEGELELDGDKLAVWTEPAFERDATCQHCHVGPICQGMACPMVRIETGERSCLDVKSNLRRDLLETVERYADAARAVPLAATAP